MYINKLIIDSGACYYIMCLMDYLRYFPKLQLIPTEKKIIGYYRQQFESNRENLCRGSIGINEQKFVLDLIIIDFDKYF